jgi:hypothetical protein
VLLIVVLGLDPRTPTPSLNPLETLPVDRVGDHGAVVGVQLRPHEQDRGDAARHLGRVQHLVELQRAAEHVLLTVRKPLPDDLIARSASLSTKER